MPVIVQRSRIIFDLGQVVNMMVLRNRKSGFTLIEIVVTLFVIVIFFALIMGIVQFSVAFFRNEDQQIASQNSLRLIALQFEKDVRKHVGTGTEFSNPNTGEYRIAVDASTSIVYLFVSNNVFRDGVLIGENVNVFDPNWDTVSQSFDLDIRSIADGYGRVNQVSARIYIRAGK
jgi:prepilin-type N-terminal cleavage/methylation domain-containing protein